MSALTAVSIAAKPAATAAAFAAFLATCLNCEGAFAACLGREGVVDAALALLAVAADRFDFVVDFALVFDRGLAALRLGAFFLWVALDAFLMTLSLFSLRCAPATCDYANRLRKSAQIIEVDMLGGCCPSAELIGNGNPPVYFEESYRRNRPALDAIRAREQVGHMHFVGFGNQHGAALRLQARHDLAQAAR